MIDNLFRELYRDLELINDKEQLVKLHTECPNCNICWKNAADRKPSPDDGFWTVTRPWIGKKFSKSRLLVIGENMNEYGGYKGAIQLITWAKEQIEGGAIKTFKSPTYSGSFVFHRMGCYATAILEHEEFIECSTYDIWPIAKDIVNTFDHISYTNHIKCSPIGQKSEQPFEMWENCGEFILLEEVKILKPEKILILGTSDNFKFFNSKILDEPIELNWEGKIGSGFGSINKRKTKLFVVPHPASFGGNSKKILSDLKDYLIKN